MKVAQARYNGTMVSRFFRGPSGEEYKFRSPEREGMWLPIESIRDAEALEEQDVYEVDWTVTGEVLHSIEEPVSGVDAMLQEMGYRQLQKLAQKLDVKATQTEEDLEQAIKPEVEQLAERMEDISR